MRFFFFFLFVAVASTVEGIRLDGFRVKFAWSGALKDVENFFNIPRNVKDAEHEGYKEVYRPIEHGLEVKMMCLEGDVRVCPLYDKAGYIAGLQIAIPCVDLEHLPYDVSTKMIMKNILGEDYWTTTHYIVSPDTIKNGGRHGPIDETIEHIWVQHKDALMEIPIYEDDLATKSLFKKQNCIPNQGTHYYYNMTEHLDCHDFFPYFPLVKHHRVIGMGWYIFGHTPEHGRKWFECLPPKSIEVTIPNASPCLEDWLKTYQMISLRMYYIDEPWKIRCEDSDSVQPISTINKFLLTSTRYSGKVVDEIKKLFG